MKQKIAYVITNPDGKELWHSLEYNKDDCMAKFLRIKAGDFVIEEGTWQYWYDQDYRVKKLYLSDKPEGSNIYSVFREGDGK